LTDGRTYGDEAKTLELAAGAGKENIGITAMGLGADWNDDLLDEMARRGTGSSHFIAEPDQAVELFHSQIQQLQHTSTRNTTLRLDTDSGVALLQAHEVAPVLRRVVIEDGVLRLGSLPAAPSLRLLLEFAVDAPARDVLRLGTFTLEAQLVQSSQRYRIRRIVLAETGAESGEAPPDIYQSAQRVATLRLQEHAWETLKRGAGVQAVSALEQLADRFLEIGAMELAVATQREVETFKHSGDLSVSGRKIIKYGTRLLALPPPNEEER
jgi:Ca-activated chloride channel family protein